MSIAKGQDPEADTLLQNTPESVYIAIPSICYMEALSIWEKEKEYNQQFQAELDKRIDDSKRDKTSTNAKGLVSHLEQARISNKERLNDIQARLYEAIDRLFTKAEMITLNAVILQQITEITLLEPETSLIKNDIMDNLILQCILHHASLHPTEEKVLVSGNTKDFGTPAVQQALQDTGINNYFSRTQNFLGWLQSQ